MTTTTRPMTTENTSTTSASKFYTADHQVRSSKVVGASVYNDQTQSIGSIDDVLMSDSNHKADTAVISVGGFLGVGSRKIVVDWNALHFGNIADKSDSITLELTKAQVAAAPEYKEDKSIVVLGAAGSLQPLDDH